MYIYPLLYIHVYLESDYDACDMGSVLCVCVKWNVLSRLISNVCDVEDDLLCSCVFVLKFLMELDVCYY